MNLLPCGDRAVLIDCDSLAEAQSWYAALPSDLDTVLGAQTVLVRGDPRPLRDLISATTPMPMAADASAEVVTIEAIYDGVDLEDVSTLTSLSINEVVAAHTGAPWTVAFGGFAPGFFYLVGGDPRLQVPRRATPRRHVPAGAVGLAGGFSGIYPRESPGGWQIIGSTAAELWNVDRDPPAMLKPGCLVQFEAV